MSPIGLLPAGGRGTRTAPLPCSKEIYPVGSCDGRPKVAAHYLLEKMARAGATRGYVVLQVGKWDIPAYFGDGAMAGMELAYLTIRDSPSTPHTLDRAFSFVRDETVLLGFADLVFEPDDAFEEMLARQADTNADVVLGLVPALDAHAIDMVETDADGRVTDIVIKPQRTELTYAWLAAVWTPAFTLFLHERLPTSVGRGRELFVGDVLIEAIAAGLHIDSCAFPKGTYRDIGDPAVMVSGPSPTAT